MQLQTYNNIENLQNNSFCNHVFFYSISFIIWNYCVISTASIQMVELLLTFTVKIPISWWSHTFFCKCSGSMLKYRKNCTGFVGISYLVKPLVGHNRKSGRLNLPSILLLSSFSSDAITGVQYHRILYTCSFFVSSSEKSQFKRIDFPSSTTPRLFTVTVERPITYFKQYYNIRNKIYSVFCKEKFI